MVKWYWKKSNKNTVILVGNKCDLENKSIHFSRSKTNLNVDEAFEILIDFVIIHYVKRNYKSSLSLKKKINDYLNINEKDKKNKIKYIYNNSNILYINEKYFYLFYLYNK